MDIDLVVWGLGFLAIGLPFGIWGLKKYKSLMADGKLTLDEIIDTVDEVGDKAEELSDSVKEHLEEKPE